MEVSMDMYVGFGGLAELHGIHSGKTIICRIMPLARFIEAIRTRRMSLVRPAQWDDPYENPMRSLVTMRDTGERFGYVSYQQDIFAQCWFLSGESDAMWRIYSANRHGVMIITTMPALLSSMDLEWPGSEACFSKIQYKDENCLRRLFASDLFVRAAVCSVYLKQMCKPLSYKRDSFSHEREARLFVKRSVHVCGENESGRTSIAFDPAVAYPRVLLDPRLSSGEFEALKAAINGSGFVGEVEHSQLYATPEIAISLDSATVFPLNPQAEQLDGPALDLLFRQAEDAAQPHWSGPLPVPQFGMPTIEIKAAGERVNED